MMDTAFNTEEILDVIADPKLENFHGYGKPKEHVQIEQQDTLTKRYQTLDEIKRELIANGLPIDHLAPPKLIEHEPS